MYALEAGPLVGLSFSVDFFDPCFMLYVPDLFIVKIALSVHSSYFYRHSTQIIMEKNNSTIIT